jgi:hypothetical protein
LFARRKPVVLLFVNLALLVAVALAGEVGFRLFWSPKYILRCDRWLVGSGMTTAGRKYWPETTYRIQSGEFQVRFRTNARGYRARPAPPRAADPYRIAFVGDSFTEGMQVEYDQTFCARIERGLAGGLPGREVIAENFGIAATGLFEYWHRITHDVLRPDPPDALVLCLYPGNDFTGAFPADGFAADGRPLREYYRDPTWTWHVMTWLNLHSQFALYLQAHTYRSWTRQAAPPQAPKLWWIDPVVTARAADAPVIRRSRSLLRAIASDCRAQGTRLCIFVVGPVLTYPAHHGRSPLAQIVADWQVDAPVIDVAIAALATPDFPRLLFPRDGHLNASGHAFVADAALPSLRAFLFPPAPQSSSAAPGTTSPVATDSSRRSSQGS